DRDAFKGRPMKRRVAMALLAVALGVLAFYVDRYFLAPREVQRLIFGEAVTGLQRPSYRYTHELGPWDETWTYSMKHGAPPYLRMHYGCEVAGARISCRRCEEKLLGMCFIKSVSRPGGEYLIARTIDGNFRVERGVRDPDED
ncbi:MAG: hypothetical protein ACJ8DZ_08505, partial [Allosphingosinicella sp.]